MLPYTYMHLILASHMSPHALLNRTYTGRRDVICLEGAYHGR